jgi:hypothetical protein
MGRNYNKRTTVRKNIFGNKVIETKWVPNGGGCLATVAAIGFLFFLLSIFFGGC